LIVPGLGWHCRVDRMASCRKFCCCMCCPCCFIFGTLQAFLLLGAAVALVFALALGPAPLKFADDVADICEAAAWFMDTKLSYTVATDRNLERWAEVCRDVFGSLDPEAQQLLRTLQAEGRHRSVLNDKSVDGRSDGWRKHLQTANQSGGLHIKETSPAVVSLEEIPIAFSAARVLRFDGRKLLPASMFNASIPEIQRLHSDSSDDTIMYGSLHVKGSICRILMLLPLSALYPRLGRTALFSVMRAALVRLQEFCALKSLSYYATEMDELKKLGPGNVNLRRVPRFDGGLKVADLIGLGDRSTRGLNLLWYGVSPVGPLDGLHTDVQDNVLIELVSPTNVYVMPRETFWDLPADANFTGDVDIYKIRLEPGDGLAIPSNFLHTVEHLQDDRLAVNYFFEPKWGAMQWPDGKGNYFTELAKTNKSHLAMRSLWFETVGALWDRHKIGISMHSWKMEVL